MIPDELMERALYAYDTEVEPPYSTISAIPGIRAALEAVAADIWAEGARAMIGGENLDWINAQNPYVDPNRHTEAK